MKKISSMILSLGLAMTLVACGSGSSNGGSADAGKYTDGTYTGTGTGHGGSVAVTVVVEGGKISSVEIGEHNETAGISDEAISSLPQAIVDADGTEGVDTISGSTETSQAILDAVNNALEGATK